jgi:hypothetical protein
MLRPSHILTTAALALCCSFASATAATAQVAPPPSSMAASHAEEYKELRSVQAEQGPYVLDRDYGSPDAADAGRDLSPATRAAPGIFTDSERKLVESAEVQAMVDRVGGEIRAASASPGTHAAPGIFTDSERKLVESAEVQAMVDRASGEIRAASASPGTHAGPGIFTDSERKLVESPEVQGMMDRASSEIRATPAVVAVEAPSGGFDWGDAGIGAAGMLGLFSIAAGSALLIGGRRRRHGVKVATH